MDTTSEISADFAHSRNVVVILGAGFSHAVYPATPMTDDLGEAVRGRLNPVDVAKLPRGKSYKAYLRGTCPSTIRGAFSSTSRMVLAIPVSDSRLKSTSIDSQLR